MDVNGIGILFQHLQRNLMILPNEDRRIDLLGEFRRRNNVLHKSLVSRLINPVKGPFIRRKAPRLHVVADLPHPLLEQGFVFGSADLRHIGRAVIVEIHVAEFKTSPQQPLPHVGPVREHLVEFGKINLNRLDKLTSRLIDLGPRDVRVVQHVGVGIATLEFRRGLLLVPLRWRPSKVAPRLGDIRRISGHFHGEHRGAERNLKMRIADGDCDLALVLLRLEAPRVEHQPHLARHARRQDRTAVFEGRQSVVEK